MMSEAIKNREEMSKVLINYICIDICDGNNFFYPVNDPFHYLLHKHILVDNNHNIPFLVAAVTINRTEFIIILLRLEIMV